jgi:kynureninase
LCFAITPKKMKLKAIISGWFANFSHLESQSDDDHTLYDEGFFLFGATQDFSALYKACHVFELLEEHGLSTKSILEYVRELEDIFLNATTLKSLIVNSNGPREKRGRFLCLVHKNANELAKELLKNGVRTDVRGETLRFSFSLYHNKDDALLSAKAFNLSAEKIIF